MSHRQSRVAVVRPTLRPLLLAASLASAPAFADWYVGLDAGTASLSETGGFGAPIAGFGGPTVDTDLCGGTATITVGAEPQVGRFDGGSTEYSLFVGKRFGAWSIELGAFNVSRFDERAAAGPYAVVQPTCNPVPADPITVASRAVKFERLKFDGWSIAPGYAWALGDSLTLELRAKLAMWERAEDSQWTILATVLEAGDPVQTYVVDSAYGDASGSGTDLWPGLGLGWRVGEGVRLRGFVEQQRFGDLTATAWTLGLAIDLP